MTLNLPDIPAGVLTPAVKDAIIARENAIVARVNAGTNDALDWQDVTSTYNGHTLVFQALAVPLAFDGVFVGMSAYCLQQCADLLGAMLHTPRSLDLTFQGRGTLIKPQLMYDPMRMMVNAWFEKQTAAILAAIAAAGGRRGIVQSVGKPWTLGNILERATGRAQNYGWHTPPGTGSTFEEAPAYQSVSLAGIRVLQQPGTAHELRFQADYASTGELMLVPCMLDGQRDTLTRIAQVPELAPLISHEGVLRVLRQPGVPKIGGRGGSPIAPPVPSTPPASSFSSPRLDTAEKVATVATGLVFAAIATGITLAVRSARAQRARTPEAAAAAEAREAPSLASNRATLAPLWHPLLEGAAYAPGLRRLAHRKNGAYAFRERRTRRVLYVGESHTRRLWKTMLRHVQPGSRSTCRKRDPKRKGGCMLFADIREWTYRGDVAGVDVAIWPTETADEAKELEGELIERLEPEHNERGYEEADEETPF